MWLQDQHGKAVADAGDWCEKSDLWRQTFWTSLVLELIVDYYETNETTLYKSKKLDPNMRRLLKFAFDLKQTPYRQTPSEKVDHWLKNHD